MLFRARLYSEKSFQAAQLFRPMERHQFRGNRTGDLRHHSPEEAELIQQTAENPGSLSHFEGAPRNCPERMSADVICLFSVVKVYGGRAIVAGADLPVVKAHFFREGLCPPALHSCGGHRHPIDCASFDRDITANRFKAGAPKHLTGARDVPQVGMAMGIGMFGGL